MKLSGIASQMKFVPKWKNTGVHMLGKALNNDLNSLDSIMHDGRWIRVSPQVSWDIFTGMKSLVMRVAWWNTKVKIRDELISYRRSYAW